MPLQNWPRKQHWKAGTSLWQLVNENWNRNGKSGKTFAFEEDLADHQTDQTHRIGRVQKIKIKRFSFHLQWNFRKSWACLCFVCSPSAIGIEIVFQYSIEYSEYYAIKGVSPGGSCWWHFLCTSCGQSALMSMGYFFFYFSPIAHVSGLYVWDIYFRFYFSLGSWIFNCQQLTMIVMFVGALCFTIRKDQGGRTRFFPEFCRFKIDFPFGFLYFLFINLVCVLSACLAKEIAILTHDRAFSMRFQLKNKIK